MGRFVRPKENFRKGGENAYDDSPPNSQSALINLSVENGGRSRPMGLDLREKTALKTFKGVISTTRTLGGIGGVADYITAQKRLGARLGKRTRNPR